MNTISTGNTLSPYNELFKYEQFIVHENKIPVDYMTFNPVNAHDPKSWTSFSIAETVADVLGVDRTAAAPSGPAHGGIG